MAHIPSIARIEARMPKMTATRTSGVMLLAVACDVLCGDLRLSATLKFSRRGGQLFIYVESTP